MAANKKVLNNRFLFYWLLTAEFDRFSNGNYSKGTLYPAIGEKDLLNGVIPLPPLKEQEEIVEIIEQAFNALEQLDVAQSQYATNVEILKSKLIDAGICGKLTEQFPEDSDAEDLYNQIQDEKAKLIKGGKIKKEKPLEDITEDEIPFEIPKNWKWVRLIDFSSIINGDRGKNYPAKSTLSKRGIPFISALNLNGYSVDTDENLLCLSEEQYNKLGSGKLQKDDVVICIRGSLGKHGKYPYDKGAIASSLVIVRPIYTQGLEVLGKYMMIWLDSTLFLKEIDKYDGGSAQPNLSAENLKKFLIPLPPIDEQKRIVEILETLLGQLQ